MKLIVNGNVHLHQGDGTLSSLLKEIKADAAQVAVLVNEEVAPRRGRARLRLKNGDKVEVLTFAGGG